MSEPDPANDQLALAAVSKIEGGMVVGLGTGRAATRAVRTLAHRITHEGLKVTGVATSERTAELARSLGIAVTALGECAHIDLLFDGADEVDPNGRMLKGRGGAMLREKIAARMSTQNIYLAQSSKRVERLGERYPVPIELIPEALASARGQIEHLCPNGKVRLNDTGDFYETDNSNWVIDAPIPANADAIELDAALHGIPGVIETGLFLVEACEVVLEDESGALERISGPSRA